MDSAGGVGDFDLAEVVLKSHLDSAVGNRLRLKLVEVDVHSHFAIIVAPRKLLDLGLLDCCVGGFLVSRLGGHEFGRTTVHETLLFL